MKAVQNLLFSISPSTTWSASMPACKLIAPVLFLCALSANAWAGLVGTNVNGSLTFFNPNTNFFNSTNGFVPSGCSNSGTVSASVTVSNPAVEFCYDDTVNTDRANFSDTSLTITDISTTGSGAFTMRFLFAPGLVTSVSELSDTFVNGGLSFSFVNDALTISSNNLLSGGSFSAVYSFTTAAAAVPEPTTLSMAALLLAIAGSLSPRRRNNGA